MGHTHKCQIWVQTGDAFDSYLMTHESVYGSPSFVNEYFGYDKLWGPSQRVVTLFVRIFHFALVLRRFISIFVGLKNYASWDKVLLRQTEIFIMLTRPD